jgi:hypothetical protein
MGGSVGGEVRVRRWILIRSPRAPRFASWRGPRPPSGLAARVPIMYWGCGGARSERRAARRCGCARGSRFAVHAPRTASRRGGVCVLAARVSIVDEGVWKFGALVRSEEQWRWEDTRIGDAVG